MVFSIQILTIRFGLKWIIIGDIGDGLYAVPELQVCWLQDNAITSCNGFEQSVQLQNLGLAGNPISSYKEV